MKRNGVSWIAVTLAVILLALGAALMVGARSAVERAFDIAEYKAADPYYQSLALRNQVVGGQNDRLVWVVGGILALILIGWLLGQAAPFVREARLAYKAVRPRRQAARQPSPINSRLPSLPLAPMLRALPDGNQPETIEYEDVDEGESVDVWSGGR